MPRDGEAESAHTEKHPCDFHSFGVKETRFSSRKFQAKDNGKPHAVRDHFRTISTQLRFSASSPFYFHFSFLVFPPFSFLSSRLLPVRPFPYNTYTLRDDRMIVFIEVDRFYSSTERNGYFADKNSIHCYQADAPTRDCRVSAIFYDYRNTLR